MKRLPIGTQDFATLRNDDCVYVDKTAAIHRLIDEGRMYFLARPRRFGKSLLVSTLKAIFEGRRDLFKGLAIDNLHALFERTSFRRGTTMRSAWSIPTVSMRRKAFCAN